MTEVPDEPMTIEWGVKHPRLSTVLDRGHRGRRITSREEAQAYAEYLNTPVTIVSRAVTPWKEDHA